MTSSGCHVKAHLSEITSRYVPSVKDLSERVAALEDLSPLDQVRAIDQIIVALGNARRQAIRAAVAATNQSVVARELGLTRQAIQLVVHPPARRR